MNIYYRGKLIFLYEIQEVDIIQAPCREGSSGVGGNVGGSERLCSALG